MDVTVMDPTERYRELIAYLHTVRNMFFNKRDGTGPAAQGRLQAIGSGETEATNGLQTRWSGQGHQAVGWRLHPICF